MVQLWKRDVPIPSKAFVQLEAIVYMLESGLRLCLETDCPACRVEKDVEWIGGPLSHECSWPSDVDILQSYLQELDVSEEAVRLLVTNTKKLFGGDFAPGPQIPFSVARDDASYRLMRDPPEGTRRDYEYLFSHIRDVDNIDSLGSLMEF